MLYGKTGAAAHVRLSRSAALALPAVAATSATAQTDPVPGPVGNIETAERIATEAYLFGYLLVTVELTRRVLTNVAQPEGTRAPLNQFARLRQYPDASFTAVTAPNADTLYSNAFLDLGPEPYVLAWPDMGSRYYLFPMLDGWTDVIAAPGTRTTGGDAQTYLLTGPRYTGPVPAGMARIASPTDLLWILGRTYCTGTPEDYRAVHALQDRYRLVPLSAWGKGDWRPPEGRVDPAVDMRTAVREQVDRMPVADYFGLLARLMETNPPAAADAPAVARMARVGIVPGRPFDAAKLPQGALDRARGAALERIKAQARELEFRNGWILTTGTGVYGTDYPQRAFVTAIGLGANRPQDAVYPVTHSDGDGRRLNGANRYVLRFPPSETPPARGFWSLTMYNDRFFFVANPLNRYTLSPRDSLKHNADGSLDLFVQADDPGPERQSNWLPAPRSDFTLMMRLYWPKAPPALSVLDGTWAPPAVQRSA